MPGKHIYIGENVIIGSFCCLMTVCLPRRPKPFLEIGNGVSLGAYSTVSAAQKIIIGDNVMTSQRVMIVDHLHDYSDIKEKNYNKITEGEEIAIEEKCFIGANVVVLPGVKIGSHSVIGANAVVSRDIPPYSIAAGVPAKVIKKYDFKLNKWVSVRKL